MSYLSMYITFTNNIHCGLLFTYDTEYCTINLMFMVLQITYMYYRV